MKLPFYRFLQSAPQIVFGAFFLFSIGLVGCEEELPKTSTEIHTPPATTQKVEEQEKPAESVVKPEGEVVTAPDAAETNDSEVRFLSYNVENYLTMSRYRNGEKSTTSKPENEKAALVQIIADNKPNVLGICEIGTQEDLKDLQSRLKAAGLDLPHTVYAGGMDTTRHLALLSAFPISANNSRDDLSYQLNGTEFLIRRGILDATVELPMGPARFIGLHLKSKRASKTFDEAEVRLNEARLAREHCDKLLTDNPDTKIVLYGDMNDTIKSPPLAMLMGNYRAENHLNDIFAKDSRKHLWTHFWSYQQQYARFDFVLVSRAMKPHVDMTRTYIADPENWNEASDHRAVMVTFKGEE